MCLVLRMVSPIPFKIVGRGEGTGKKNWGGGSQKLKSGGGGPEKCKFCALPIRAPPLLLDYSSSVQEFSNGI